MEIWDFRERKLNENIGKKERNVIEYEKNNIFN